jgi:hypothetical protein
LKERPEVGRLDVVTEVWALLASVSEKARNNASNDAVGGNTRAPAWAIK